MQNSCDQSSKDSFFSFCFVEFLIGMQNDSIQGTSILVRLVSYMYDMNNALNISALNFFFIFKPAWYGRIHFFFCPVPSIIHVFCSWCFWKPIPIIEPLFTVYDRARQIIIQRLPNARQSSGLQIGSITVVWLEKKKKKSYAKSCWNFKFGASWVIANRIIYLSLSLRTLSQVPTFISLSLGLFPKYFTTRVSVDVNALSSLVSTYYG